MPLLFIRDFPREIRDQIYTYVLASRSGAVTLSPWSVDVARSLNLLRTCKQIHRECKDLIWLHNRLSLRSPTQLSQKLRSTFKFGHGRRIRLLKICLEVLDRDELDWFASAVSCLVDWCRHGRLESITIVADWDKPRGVEEFQEIQALRKHGKMVDGRLHMETCTWTRMAVSTAWPRFCHWGKQRWLKEMLLDTNGVNQLLAEIHKAFGGKLYVDGRLCFRDQKQIVKEFHLDPRIGEIRIIPAVGVQVDNAMV